MRQVVAVGVADSAGGRMDARQAGGLVLDRSGAGSKFFVLWHLLSMDAPTVAVCWTAFTASAAGLRLPLVSGAAMWLAVWALYAADRLFDTRHLAAREWRAGEMLEARHLFHARYRGLFSVGVFVSLAGLCVLLPMLPSASLRLYGVEGVFMAGYFCAVHTIGGSRRGFAEPHGRWGGRLPKELLVGPFFAAAVFIPTVARRPELRWELVPLAVLFGGLCSLNCLSIFAWEHTGVNEAPLGTGWAVRRLGSLTCAFTALSLMVCLFPASRGLWPMNFRLDALACAGGGVALGVCNRFGRGLPRTALRAAADLCLLTPLLVFPFLRSS